MLFVLDNYDSFTWNLVQFFGELGCDPAVHRNDALAVDDVLALAPAAIVVSPGPCAPADAGISVPLVRAAAERGIPVLGVCLGHQAIGEAFGGRIVRADRLMHGKTSPIRHRGDGLFAGLADPLTVMRYHSLVIEPATAPAVLEVSAWTADRPPAGAGTEIMAVAHRERPVWGVQFHPESIGTEHGRAMLSNFLQISGLRPHISRATASA
ncbi:MAG: aminodeoxychorismate/anthranilate synthase component II [Gemmatimonadales bacterium]|nr:aminodeoxychorismate/anthranilate synthase component II [Gemmatimonadales bacterium]